MEVDTFQYALCERIPGKINELIVSQFLHFRAIIDDYNFFGLLFTFPRQEAYCLFQSDHIQHDYIAHVNFTRRHFMEKSKNDLFVGHPGEWDYDILQTMHKNSILKNARPGGRICQWNKL